MAALGGDWEGEQNEISVSALTGGLGLAASSPGANAWCHLFQSHVYAQQPRGAGGNGHFLSYQLTHWKNLFLSLSTLDL